MRHQLSGSVRN